MANLSSSTVMLTGAGGALAAAIAQELDDAGAQIVLVGRGESLARAADRFPATEVIDTDLTDPQSVELLRKVKVDTLIHTVGQHLTGDAHKVTAEEYTSVFDSNMRSLFHAVQGTLPHMLKQKDGMILAIAGSSTTSKEALYAASKAAAAGYVLSLHEEYKSRGVRGCVIYPMGAVDSPKSREAGIAWEAMIDPRGLAKSVAHALGRPDRAHITELKIYPDQ